MPRTPDTLGALLPDVVAPVSNRCDVSDLSPRAKKAAWMPKSHTDAEVAAARRVLTHWNNTFRGVEGGSIAQVNNMANVRHYVRTLRRCREEGDVFARITEQRVIAAISGYRSDLYNVKARRWKRFMDWLDPENILKYAGHSSAADHAIAQPAREKKQLTALQAKAQTVLEHRGFTRFFASIAVKALPLALVIKENQRNTPEFDRFIELVRAIKARRDGLDGPSRGALLQRARAVFDAWFNRPPKTEADRGIMEGLEFSLLDLDAAGKTRASKMEAAHA